MSKLGALLAYDSKAGICLFVCLFNPSLRAKIHLGQDLTQTKCTNLDVDQVVYVSIWKFSKENVIKATLTKLTRNNFTARFCHPRKEGYLVYHQKLRYKEIKEELKSILFCTK